MCDGLEDQKAKPALPAGAHLGGPPGVARRLGPHQHPRVRLRLDLRVPPPARGSTTRCRRALRDNVTWAQQNTVCTLQGAWRSGQGVQELLLQLWGVFVSILCVTQACLCTKLTQGACSAGTAQQCSDLLLAWMVS